MSPDPIRRGLPAVLAVCVAIVLVAAVYFIAQYRAGDRAQRAWTGMLAGEPIEAGGLEGFLTPAGFLVTTIDGRARGWGLQVGDTIRSVGKEPVRTTLQVQSLAPGARIGVVRAGEPLDLRIGEAATLRAADVRAVDARGVKGQITPEGLWATGVDGDAARWGLRPGDLIRSVDGQPLTVRRDATSLLHSLDPHTGFVFEIVRDGSRLYLPYNSHAQGMTAAAQMPATRATAAGPAFAPQAWAGMVPARVSCPVCGAVSAPGGVCWQCGAAMRHGVGAGWPAAAAGARVDARAAREVEGRERAGGGASSARGNTARGW